MRGTAAPLALLLLAGTLRLALAQEAAVEEPAAAAVNPNPLSSLTLESLEATRSLPLFTPSRTAPMIDAPVEEEIVAEPIEPEPLPEEAPPPALELIGIVMTGSTQTALLRNPTTNEVLRLKPGDVFEDWALKIIDARSIELRRGDSVQEMKMFEIFPVSAAQGDPYGQGMPPDMQGMPPEMNAQSPPEEMPLEDQGGMPGAPPPDAGFADSPPLEGEPGAFAPQRSNAPIPEEGALLPEEGTGVEP